MNEDLRLIEEARKGSQSAVVALLRLHQSRVRGYLLRYVRSKEVVDDLAQETFMRAFRDLDRFKGESPFSIWLLGIARHRALDFLREEEVRRANQGRVFDAAMARWRAVEAARDGRGLSERDGELSTLLSCVDGLAPTSASLVREHYFNARSLADVALQAGKSEGAMKTTLFRIREALRECVERRQSPAGASL